MMPVAFPPGSHQQSTTMISRFSQKRIVSLLMSDLLSSRIMIRCPVTGRPISTGLTADPKTWSGRPLGINKVACPECKSLHAWSKPDAWLERDAAPNA